MTRPTYDDLKASEELLRLALENIPDPLFITDDEGSFTFICPNVPHLLGYSVEEVRNMGTVFDLLGIEPIDRKEVEGHQRVDDIEAVVVDKAGRRLTYRVSVNPVSIHGGTFLYTCRDITDRKAMERDLLRSHEDLRLAQRTASIGSWSLDPEEGTPVWSEEIYRIYERDPRLGPYPLAEYNRLYKGIWLERFTTAIQGAVNEGRAYDIELRLELPSGKIKWINAICEPESEAGPMGHRLHGTIQDITRRKLDELKIHESETRLKQAQALGRIGYWEYDLVSGEITWSDEVYKLFERDPVDGPPAFEENMAYYHPEDSQRLQEQVCAAAERGITSEDDYRVRLPSGKTVWHHGKIDVETDDDGKTIKLWGTVQDITQSKELEESLTNERQRLHMLLEAFPGFIYLQAADHSVRYANAYFRKNFGDPEGQPCHQVLRKRNTPCVPCPTFTVFETRSPLKREWPSAPDGRHYMIHDHPFIDVDGTELVLGIGLDITELKEAEEQKRTLEENLRQAYKMEAIGTLAGGIAHDFNNVLGIIVGNLELAAEDVAPKGPAQFSLDEARKACLRAKDMIQQILSFSRQEAGALRPIDILPIAKEAMKMMRASIPATIEIHQDYATPKAMIMGDPTRIHQVLINLCTNASQAMTGTGDRLQVRLESVEPDRAEPEKMTTATSGKYIHLAVSDTGHGIEPDHLGKVFDPYFTTKGIGKGTGMGLAVVHGIVTDHGGTITVSSRVGQGTTFDLYFPELDRGVEGDKIVREALPTGDERILLVDDEAPLADLCKRMLESLGYRVVSRTSSVGALDAFRNDPAGFDAVVTDMTMPDLTGKNLATEIMRIRPDIPIVLCTGFSHAIDEEEALALGIRGFLMKPLLREEIARTIRRVLDTRD